MQYTFSGDLCGTVCANVDEPVTDAEVRLYRVEANRRELATHLAARPKETFQILEDAQVEAKSEHHIASTSVEKDGSYEVTLSEEEHDYDGEAVAIDVRLEGVPGPQDPDAEPVQVAITTHQPEWRKAEGGARARFDHCFSADVWCRIRALFGSRVICGSVSFCERDAPVNDVTVRAYDADIIEDDPLGEDVTAGAGHFLIHYHREDFVKTPLSPFLNVELEHGPDLYFTVEASDGTTLLEEPRSKGRESGREDVGVCAHVTDLCVPDKPQEPEPDDDLTTTLWTGIGDAFDVPTDFTDDGYAAPGGTEYALTGTIDLTGDTEILTDDGNPVEYRFRLSDTTASNGAGALPASEFDESSAAGDRSGTVGVGINADAFVNTVLGKAMVFESASSRLVPITVRATRSDLDGDGWLRPDSVLNRALTDAGYTRSDLLYFDDEDELMRLNTGDIAPGDSSPPSPPAGQSVDTAADGFETHRFAIRFEARDAVTGGSLSGSGQTMNRLVMDNNATVTAIDLKKTDPRGPCKPTSGPVSLAYTAYHPHLDWVTIHRQRNENSPGEIKDDEPDTTKAPVDIDTTGGTEQVYSYDGTGDPEEVPNHFDITPSETCTYIVWMRSRRRLHTGNSQLDASRTRLIPFYYES